MGDWIWVDTVMLVARAVLFLATCCSVLVTRDLFSEAAAHRHDGRCDSREMYSRCPMNKTVWERSEKQCAGCHAEFLRKAKKHLPITIVLIIFTAVELALNNPNEWLAIKLVIYFALWYVCSGVYGDSIVALLLPVVIASVIASVPVCRSVHNEESITELVSSVELLAAGDGFSATGSGSVGLFGGSFAISENGYYRYYYADGSGGIHQGSVQAASTVIYYTSEGGQPRLEVYDICHVNHTQRNHRLIEDKYTTGTTYRLYVPAGSVVENYQFDLH